MSSGKTIPSVRANFSNRCNGYFCVVLQTITVTSPKTSDKEKDMKPTGTVRRSSGITRRLDELGRVTVPKSIRRSLRIRDGDALEIFTGHDGEIIFKKYSPIGELTSFAEEYAETLYKTCSLCVLICDRDGVIAAAGVSPRKDYLDKSLTEELDELMEKRSLYSWRDGMEKVTAVHNFVPLLR